MNRMEIYQNRMERDKIEAEAEARGRKNGEMYGLMYGIAFLPLAFAVGTCGISGHKSLEEPKENVVYNFQEEILREEISSLKADLKQYHPDNQDKYSGNVEYIKEDINGDGKLEHILKFGDKKLILTWKKGCEEIGDHCKLQLHEYTTETTPKKVIPAVPEQVTPAQTEIYLK